MVSLRLIDHQANNAREGLKSLLAEGLVQRQR